MNMLNVKVGKLQLTPAQLKPQGFTLLIACIAALGAALVLAQVLAHGVWLDGDSLFYITYANNLLAEQAYTDIFGNPAVLRPPGFSALLAIAGFASLPPLQAAGWVNAAALGLAIFFGGRWLSQKIASRFLTVWACLAIAFTPAVAKTALHAWSEPTFILFTTLALLQVDKFLGAARRSSLIWAAVFTALACMTRYIGVAFIALTLSLLVLQHGVAIRRKLKRMAAYALIAAAPLGAWLTRNYLAKGTLAGARHPASGDPSENALLVLEVLLSWAPDTVTQSLGGVATGMAGVLLLALLALLVRACVRLTTGADRRANFVAVNGGLAAFYIAAVLAGTANVQLTPIDNRYLSPAYMPLLFMGVLIMDRILQRWQNWTVQKGFTGAVGFQEWWRKAKSLVLPAAVTAALCLWMALLVWDGLRGTLAVATGPAGLWTPRYWQESAVPASLPKQNFDGRIWSNAHPLIDFFLDAPKNGLDSRWLPPTKQQLQQAIAKGDLIAYFFHASYPGTAEDYGLADLRSWPELEIIVEESYGLLFEAKGTDRNDSGEAQEIASRFTALGKPVVRSNFDLHLRGGELIFTKTPCVHTDAQTRFFLHLVPADIDDPAFPEERRQYGFDNLDFDFDRWGLMRDDACMVARPLPQYDIKRISTGQYISGQGRRIWSVDFTPG